MRLNKFLAHGEVASRRACDQLIFDGRVKVNNETVLEPGRQVEPEKDMVMFDREVIKLVMDTVVILLHKPKGVVTTVHDELGRKTVLDLIDYPHRIVPVGRLDKDTTGALLISNDGELTYRLTHPKFKIEREYQVILWPPLNKEDIECCDKGFELDNGDFARFEILEQTVHKNRATIRLLMYHGKNREIRRGFKLMGRRVLALHRKYFSGISADKLACGKWRKLNKKEVESLWKKAR